MKKGELAKIMGVDKLKNIVIKIDVNLGSKFQEKVAVEAIIAMVKEFLKFLKRSHKHNKVGGAEIKFNQE